VQVDECTLDLTLTEETPPRSAHAGGGGKPCGLHRWKIGGLELPATMEPGHWRWLTAADWSCCTLTMACMACEACHW
jgi:16S rRNA pseudouridine516 synthase